MALTRELMFSAIRLSSRKNHRLQRIKVITVHHATINNYLFYTRESLGNVTR